MVGMVGINQAQADHTYETVVAAIINTMVISIIHSQYKEYCSVTAQLGHNLHTWPRDLPGPQKVTQLDLQMSSVLIPTNDSTSTQSLVKPDHGRRFVGTALTDWTNNLSEMDHLLFLQA
eukprot:2462267-Rhodomonas_salina.2